jgi:hypothetical protein
MKSEDNEGIRVILRGRAAGGITQADVQRRARELSLIRTGHENYTADDIDAAEHELIFGTGPAAMTDDAESSVSANRDPSDPLSEHGTMEARRESAEENTTPEKLALQGVEEAQHDQMVEARRQKTEMPRVPEELHPNQPKARRVRKSSPH